MTKTQTPVERPGAAWLEAIDDLDRGSARQRLPSFVRSIRRNAMDRFAASGLPRPHEEEWRYTNVAPLGRLGLRPVSRAISINPHAEKLSRFFLARFVLRRDQDPMGIRLVFLNGRWSKELSDTANLPAGVAVRNLAGALEANPELLEAHLGRYAPEEEAPFTALNSAFLQDGAVVHIAPGTVVEAPIQLLFFLTAGDSPVMVHPRNLIVAGENSSVSVVETYAGTDEQRYLVNAVTEIAAGGGADVSHYKIQQEGVQAYHVGRIEAHQERDSRLRSSSVSLGGLLARNDIRVAMDGEGCSCDLDGLYLAGGSQHVDNHTCIDHRRPRGTSRETYKGVLDRKATGVFNGKVYIREGAQQSDAQQVNHNLLLSEDAVINTKPQLEIFADDVKCAHGATIGRLDGESIFYLRSRGIGEEKARELLVYAFANAVIERIRLEPVRRQLSSIVWSKFQKNLEDVES